MEGKKEKEAGGDGARPSLDIAAANGDAVGNGSAEAAAEANGDGEVPPTPGAEGGLDPAAKKVRNLSKKVRATVFRCSNGC